MPRNVLKLGAINVAVLAVLAFAALAALEAWLRLTIPASSKESIYLYTLATPRYKVMKPNASVVAWGKELRTNELGFRDEAASVPPKRPGEFRIIVLGASFTVSAGVDYRQIYTTLLRERLKQAHSGVSVINLAVGGYNIVQYAAVLQEVGLQLDPDMVLVAICPNNDFRTRTYETNYRVASGLEPAQPDLPWYEELYVYRAYLGKVAARLDRMLAADKAAESAAGSEAGWALNSAALHSIVEITRRHNLPLAAVLLPETWNLERQRTVFARVEGMCRELGVPCLNMLEPILARGLTESGLRLNPLDPHPNETYNAVVAEELAPYFSARLAPGAEQ